MHIEYNPVAVNQYTSYLKLLMEEHLQDALLIAIEHNANRIFSHLLDLYPNFIFDVDQLILQACMGQETPALRLILKSIYEHPGLLEKTTADNRQKLGDMFYEETPLR